MSDGVKPCPFCGSNAEVRKKAGKWAVSCMSEVDCCGQVDIGDDGLNGWESPTFAAAAWNERASFPKVRTDAAPGMSDGELIARATLLTTEHAIACVGSQWSSSNSADLVAELDRRAALRKEAKT